MADKQPLYEIVKLPHIPFPTNPSANLTAFATKVRDLRLRSLQTDPDAFARSYDEEIKWGLDATFQRLSNPEAVQFLAVKKTSGVPTLTDDDEKLIESLLEDEWLGHVVILGPQEDDGSNPREFPGQPDRPFPLLDTSTGQIIPPERLIFRIGGTYVDPAGRGLGLGSKLMQATLRQAEVEGKKWGAVGVRVGLAVFGHNVAAIRTYEKAGFRVVEERPSRSRPGMVAVIMENRLVEKS